ncbi:MAG: protease [Labilithrix sp.]|nr:protease [Labilithrix sp.]
MKASRWIALALVPLAAALALGRQLHAPAAPAVDGASAADAGESLDPSLLTSHAPDAGEPKMDPGDDDHDDDRSYVFRVPSGEPTMLSCDEARTIVDQVRAGLAYPPGSVPTAAFATSSADWLDPHGLLSLAKDAPTARAIGRAAADLVADLEGRRKRSCDSALAPGATLEQWSNDLRDAFDRGRKAPGNTDPVAAATEPLPPTGLAREVALEIGRRVGAFEQAHGADARPYGDEARRRFFPPLDKAGWAKVVLASAVRAYVPLVDPHGEWAPFDEESRIYEVDLASRPPSRLWGRAVPTAVGVRVTDSATAPLAENDIILSVAHVATAGLPLEQIDQLGFATADAKNPLTAVIVRGGVVQTLELGKPEEPAGTPRAAAELPSERVAFGDGDVLRVEIKDVRDDLGDDLASLIATERDRGPRKLTGIVLDLRGNGGGSTDGAMGALGLFLPGAPLFAMKRRDGTVEIDRAPVPRERDRWTGPVATFVDGTTASAAEMIAGALATYKRGPTVGTSTFGKGCAQEYVDDDAHAGVLRLTTLVYALPDGTPVQRVGLVPQLRFPFVSTENDAFANEREAKLPHAAPPWRGPDLRDAVAARAAETPWPATTGAVGPCRDADVCRALRALGTQRRPPTPVAKH